MSGRLLNVFIGLLVISSSYGSYSPVATSPILMWSNTNTFVGRNFQEVSIVNMNQINDAMPSWASQRGDVSSKYFTESATPSELVILFTEPKLSSEQFSLLAQAHLVNPNGGALSNLKNFVETSKSSLVFPYVASSFVGKQLASHIESTIKGSTFTLTAEELENKLRQGDWNVLNNGVTDLIVVEFSSPAVASLLDDSSVHSLYASDDASIANIIALVKDVKYTAIFTSNGADSQVLDTIEVAERQGRSEMAQFRDTYNQDGDLLYTTNWPVGVVEGLLVMAPFVAILFIGLCCIMQVQSDLKFGAEKAILRKQFM